jgi:hypothetical protein
MKSSEVSLLEEQVHVKVVIMRCEGTVQDLEVRLYEFLILVLDLI